MRLYRPTPRSVRGFRNEPQNTASVFTPVLSLPFRRAHTKASLQQETLNSGWLAELCGFPGLGVSGSGLAVPLEAVVPVESPNQPPVFHAHASGHRQLITSQIVLYPPTVWDMAEVIQGPSSLRIPILQTLKEKAFQISFV